MLKDGQPDLTNPAVISTLNYIDSMYKAGVDCARGLLDAGAGQGGVSSSTAVSA